MTEQTEQTDQNEHHDKNAKHPMAKRFRGFYPVVIDIETGGFEAKTDAILECAATMIEMDEQGQLYVGETIAHHIEPFHGSNIEPASLEFTGIRLDSALRMAVSEQQALREIFSAVRHKIKQYHCQRGVLVGHNAWFDRGFLLAATARCGIKRDPFHPFTSFDTATLAAACLGHSVLAKALARANLGYDHQEAHSALYDAQCTAQLFCYMINHCIKVDLLP